MHIHYNQFSSKEKNDFKIKDHLVETMSLFDFLSCRSPVQTPRLLKGIYMRVTPVDFKFYIFQNDFYFKTSVDVVETNFIAYDEVIKQSKLKRVKFDKKSFEQVEYERINIKYIKYVTRNTIYHTRNERESWELEFKEEKLIAKKRTDRHLNVCFFNILPVNLRYFCFDKKVFYSLAYFNLT